MDQSEQLCLSILDLGPAMKRRAKKALPSKPSLKVLCRTSSRTTETPLFDIDAVLSLLDEPAHTIPVFLQECELMNALIETMIATLEELDLGFKGELTMGDHMERLQDALFFRQSTSGMVQSGLPIYPRLHDVAGQPQGPVGTIQRVDARADRQPVVTRLSGYSILLPSDGGHADDGPGPVVGVGQAASSYGSDQEWKPSEFSAHSRDGLAPRVVVAGRRSGHAGAMLAPSAAGEMTRDASY